MGFARTVKFVRRAAAFRTMLPHLRVYWRAFRDPRTPRWAKIAMLGAIGYAVSPVDLVPDVIPFAGWLDDLIISPAVIAMALRAIPREVLEDAERAEGLRPGEIHRKKV